MKRIRAAFTKQVLIAIIAIGGVALLLLYSLVYLKYADKTQELETSNQQLRATIKELEAYYKNQEQYNQDKALMEEEIDKTLELYPSDIRPEDAIMLAVNVQEKAEIYYFNINIAEQNVLYEIPGADVKGASIEGLEQGLTFKENKVGYVNKASYSTLKESVEQIYASDYLVGINSIVYIKGDEDELLAGTIELEYYYADGTGKEYVCPDIAEYLSGTDNIFGD